MQWTCTRGREQIMPTQTCSCTQRERDVKVISFTSAFPFLAFIPLLMIWVLAILQVRIAFCEHHPPAASLVKIGAFSSTPIKPPMWAFDITLLEYMSKQFAYGTPDISAWCNATSSFLSSQGVEKVPSPVRHSSLYGLSLN
jgi:hypothetical protein